MPKYLPPRMTPNCVCRNSTMRAMFCPTGHMLECHVGMDCQTAGCSHLSGYDFDPETVKALQERANAMFKMRANSECPNCQGGGMKTITATFPDLFGVQPDQVPADWPGRVGDEVEVLAPCDCLEPFEQWKERRADELGL